VVNPRFAALAEEEREKNRDRDMRRQGPPPAANSRFAAAAEADRPYRDDRERGPPPVANSRFAAAAAAAEMERPPPREERGPPPVANSRFAAAAAMAEQEQMDYEERRRDRDRFYGRGDDRRPPAQNSRFAAAAAADEDYVDRDERNRRMMEDDDRRGHGRGFHDEGPPRDERFAGRDYQEEAPRSSRVDELLKPKAPPVEDNILNFPTKVAPELEANVLKPPPTKPLSKEHEVNVLSPPEKKEQKAEAETAPAKKEEEEEAPASLPTGNYDELLEDFASGNMLGDDLKDWCLERKTVLPPVEKLVFHMLTEREKLNPDPECGWAEPSRYGAALLALVEDDVLRQMQVLWGIQFYCDKLGFPKLNDESVVQSMFRSMYRYDLADETAMAEWKEDESYEHERGKMNAIIQTVDWFNWLEEDEEEEEDYEE